MFRNVSKNYIKSTAREFIEELLRDAALGEGVTHLAVNVDTDAGERVIVLHVEIEGAFTPEEWAKELESLDESNTTEPILN